MTPDPQAPPPPPWRSPLCFAVVVLLVALDLWSKAAVFQLLGDPQTELVRDAARPRYHVLGPWLAFMENHNYGAAFGQGDRIAYLLVPLRAVALLVVSVLIVRAPAGQRVYLASLVLIVSGAAGNLYDNLFNGPQRAYEVLGLTVRVGPVRDFIDFYVPPWDWHFATFNVADACISVGAVLLVLSGLGSKGSAEGEGAGTGSAVAREAQTGGAQTGDGQTGDGQTGDGQTGDAQARHAARGDAEEQRGADRRP